MPPGGNVRQLTLFQTRKFKESSRVGGSSGSDTTAASSRNINRSSVSKRSAEDTAPPFRIATKSTKSSSTVCQGPSSAAVEYAGGRIDDQSDVIVIDDDDDDDGDVQDCVPVPDLEVSDDELASVPESAVKVSVDGLQNGVPEPDLEVPDDDDDLLAGIPESVFEVPDEDEQWLAEIPDSAPPSNGTNIARSDNISAPAPFIASGNDGVGCVAPSIECFEKCGGDLLALDSWVFPINYQERQYQFNMTRSALYINTLVCLPTGLGKTFIAAVVMYNYYRWFPSGSVVFMAPTRPLVAQQVQACYRVVALPKSDTAQITGAMPPSARRQLWSTRRVFFLTPHVLLNDMASGTVNAERIRCLVIDEAHRAQGNYPYCLVVRELHKVNRQVRILALTATPGTLLDNIQQVLANLMIGKIEYRSESSPDVAPYCHQRVLEKIVVSLDQQLSSYRDRMLTVIGMFMRRIRNHKLIYGFSDLSLSKYQLIKARETFRKNKHRSGIPNYLASLIESDFAVCMKLYHALELLTIHGARSCFNFINNGTPAELRRNEVFTSLLHEWSTLYAAAGNDNQPGVSSNPSHPKLIKLREIVGDHFHRQQQDEQSRVMIFCQYRDSVLEIVDTLKPLEPLVKAMQFVGQGSGRTSRGFSQKQQLKVIKEFCRGGYNTLVCTCVAEEGLDIGEVDLIVCYDVSRSPVRLTQRMGRTGRKRQGRVVVLVCAGKEEAAYSQSLRQKNTISTSLLDSSKLRKHLYADSPRMLPASANPVCQKLHMCVPDTEEPQTQQKQPAKTKKKRARVVDNVLTRVSRVSKKRQDGSATSRQNTELRNNQHRPSSAAQDENVPPTTSSPASITSSHREHEADQPRGDGDDDSEWLRQVFDIGSDDPCKWVQPIPDPPTLSHLDLTSALLEDLQSLISHMTLSLKSRAAFSHDSDSAMFDHVSTARSRSNTAADILPTPIPNHRQSDPERESMPDSPVLASQGSRVSRRHKRIRRAVSVRESLASSVKQLGATTTTAASPSYIESPIGGPLSASIKKLSHGADMQKTDHTRSPTDYLYPSADFIVQSTTTTTSANTLPNNDVMVESEEAHGPHVSDVLVDESSDHDMFGEDEQLLTAIVSPSNLTRAGCLLSGGGPLKNRSSHSAAVPIKGAPAAAPVFDFTLELNDNEFPAESNYTGPGAGRSGTTTSKIEAPPSSSKLEASSAITHQPETSDIPEQFFDFTSQLLFDTEPSPSKRSQPVDREAAVSNKSCPEPVDELSVDAGIQRSQEAGNEVWVVNSEGSTNVSACQATAGSSSCLAVTQLLSLLDKPTQIETSTEQTAPVLSPVRDAAPVFSFLDDLLSDHSSTEAGEVYRNTRTASTPCAPNFQRCHSTPLASGGQVSNSCCHYQSPTARSILLKTPSTANHAPLSPIASRSSHSASTAKSSVRHVSFARDDHVTPIGRNRGGSNTPGSCDSGTPVCRRRGAGRRLRIDSQSSTNTSCVKSAASEGGRGSDSDFDDGGGRQIALKSKRCAPDRIGQCVGSDRSMEDAVSVIRRKKRRRVNMFLDCEADVSADRGGHPLSGDESSGRDEDEQEDDSIIDDQTQATQNGVDMRAIYLRSVKSPSARDGAFLTRKSRGTTSLPHSQLFSQEPHQDTDYMMDSFCVGDDYVASDESSSSASNSIHSQTSPESPRPRRKRRRVLSVSSSSSSCEEADPVHEDPGEDTVSRVSLPSRRCQSRSIRDLGGENTNPRSSPTFSSTLPVLNTELVREQRIERARAKQAEYRRRTELPSAAGVISSSSPAIRDVDGGSDVSQRSPVGDRGGATRTEISHCDTSGSRGGTRSSGVFNRTAMQSSVIYVSSRQLPSASALLSDLRLRHAVSVHVMSLHTEDYVISHRLAVLRHQSASSSTAARSRLVDSISCCSKLYDRCMVVLEVDRSRCDSAGSRGITQLVTRLLMSRVFVLQSQNQVESAELLSGLCRRESAALGFPLPAPVIPASPPADRNLLERMYESRRRAVCQLLQCNIAAAAIVLQRFHSLASFIASAPDEMYFRLSDVFSRRKCVQIHQFMRRRLMSHLSRDSSSDSIVNTSLTT